MPNKSERLRVLLLSSPAAECALLLQEALGPHADLVTATSVEECLRLLESSDRPVIPVAPAPRRVSAETGEKKFHGFDAFLCDWCYQGGTWKEALERIHRRAPHLPMLVICRTGEEEEWLQVLKAGGFDMLTAPFTAESVLFALMNAVASGTEPALLKTA
jgi:CheY-like chemotaxis protein